MMFCFLGVMHICKWSRGGSGSGNECFRCHLKGSHSPDIVICFIIGMFQTVMASDSSAYRMKYRKLQPLRHSFVHLNRKLQFQALLSIHTPFECAYIRGVNWLVTAFNFFHAITHSAIQHTVHWIRITLEKRQWIFTYTHAYIHTRMNTRIHNTYAHKLMQSVNGFSKDLGNISKIISI